MHQELKQKIRDSGLKQCYIAQKIGVSPALLCQWLNGRVYIPQDKLKAIIEILKLRNVI
ncbi:helix-turn-helix domain-containing protein [Desulfofundulus thermocisternus]|uniref:helix-turn-helix domain-containing protein n=1 Tax=Desulfofundulus thermocisternus TaxID=42471 RepID=UPI0035C67738